MNIVLNLGGILVAQNTPPQKTQLQNAPVPLITTPEIML